MNNEKHFTKISLSKHLYIWLSSFLLAVFTIIELRNQWLYLPIALVFSLMVIVIKKIPKILAQSGKKPYLKQEVKQIRYAKWLIHLRWMALLAGYIFIFGSVKVLKLLPKENWLPLISIIFAIALYNLFFRFLVSVKERSLLLTQLTVDLMALTFALHFSGGIENPFALLAVFHVIIASIILTRKLAFIVTFMASSFISSLFILEWAGVLGHYTMLVFPHGGGEDFHVAHHTIYVFSRILLNFLVFYLIAFFVIMLARWATENEEKQKTMTDRAVAGHRLLVQSLATTNTALCVYDKELNIHWANDLWNNQFLADGEFKVNIKNLGALASLKDGQSHFHEVNIINHNEDPPTRTLAVITAPIFDQSHHVQKIAQIAQDITKRKEAEEKIKHLSGRIIQIQEKERSRIANTIHESIGSSLYALKILIHSTFSEIKEASPSSKEEYIKLVEYLNVVMNDTRKLSHHLSPTTLEKLGIFEAIIELVKTYQKSENLLITIEANDLKTFFQENWQVNLYRIIQESLINIVKHSGASKVKIIAKVIRKNLSVRIIDNGVGFNLKHDNEKQHGLGLLIMREHASLISATLQVKSKINLGTVIKIEIPRYKKPNE